MRLFNSSFIVARNPNQLTYTHRGAFVHRKRGVTLIEVLIVVAIIALVAGAASVAGIKAWESALRKSALTDARAIRSAIKTYWLQEGDTGCPTMERLTTTGILDSDGRKTDPWGTRWAIKCNDTEVIVTSAGRDKLFGNDDDVVAPAP